MTATDYPAHWSGEAIDAFDTVIGQREDLDGAEFAALTQAAELISQASALDEVARAAGYVSTGSARQVVTHPAQIESRLARSKAADVLARLSKPSVGSSSAAARALVSKRWRR